MDPHRPAPRQITVRLLIADEIVADRPGQWIGVGPLQLDGVAVRRGAEDISGHLYVHQDNIEVSLLQQLQCLTAVFGYLDRMAPFFQNERHYLAV